MKITHSIKWRRRYFTFCYPCAVKWVDIFD